MTQFNAQGVRTGGGLGCAGCHNSPAFDIDPNSRNNGVIALIDGLGTDVDVTRAPSLRDFVQSDGTLNGELRPTGDMDVADLLDHYNQISVVGNDNLDQRLRPAGQPLNLALTIDGREAVTAFPLTLAGTDVYTNEKWSDPFLSTGSDVGVVPHREVDDLER